MIPRHGMETGKFFVSQLSEIFQNSKITVWIPKFTQGQDYLLPMNFEIRISYFVGQWFNHKAMDLITGLKLVCYQKKHTAYVFVYLKTIFLFFLLQISFP